MAMDQFAWRCRHEAYRLYTASRLARPHRGDTEARRKNKNPPDPQRSCKGRRPRLPTNKNLVIKTGFLRVSVCLRGEASLGLRSRPRMPPSDRRIPAHHRRRFRPGLGHLQQRPAPHMSETQLAGGDQRVEWPRRTRERETKWEKKFSTSSCSAATMQSRYLLTKADRDSPMESPMPSCTASGAQRYSTSQYDPSPTL